MSIVVACPECDHSFKVKDELAGRKAKCPECGERVPVPDEDEPPRKRKSADADTDEARPRRKKKKSKKSGSSMGLVFGLVGGGLLLVIVIVVVVIVLNSGSGGLGSGGGSTDKTMTLQIGPGRTETISINCNTDQRMVVTIRTELSDPSARFEAWVEIEDLISRKKTTLARGSGPNCRLEWTSPDFGSLPIMLSNHGPGEAKCHISHNGF